MSILIDDEGTLRQLCDRVREGEDVALDTEFVWEKTYYPALGLVQVGLGGDDVHLIDTVALAGRLGALGEVLADERVVKVLHDAAQDLQILARATGALPVNVFDTQRAAGLVGQTATASLQDLVDWAVDVRLDKGQTRSDWLRRPLSDKQIGYAEDDVRYLLDAFDRLEEEAEKRGRLDWIDSEMERYDDPALYEETDPMEAVSRVKARGLGRLSGRQRAVLRAVSAWREREARHLDRTRRMVVPDDVLASLAERMPRSEQELGKAGMTGRQIGRFGAGVLEAVAEGHELPEEPPTRRGRPGPEEHRRAAQLLIAQGFLYGRCEREGVDSLLIATKSDLAGLIEAGPEAVRESLTGWRYDFFGRDLEALLRGDLAVTLHGDDGWPAAR